MPAVAVLEAVRELQQFLAAKPWRYALVGGLAVCCRGEARTTQDVDVSLVCDFGSVGEVIDSLLEHFRPRIDDPVDFAMQNHTLLIAATNGIGLDVGLALFPFEEAIIERATPARLAHDLELPVVVAEDLVLMKCLAGRPQDWADIYNLIRHAGPLDWSAIDARLQSIAELIDINEMTEHLRQLRKQAGDLIA
jgi:hypothetical protein